MWTVPPAGGEPEWAPIADGSFLLAPSATFRQPRLVYENWTYDVDVWRTPLDTGDAEPVITSTQWDGSPRFSPDGASVAFTSLRSGHMELWIADASFEAPEKVTAMEGPLVQMPRWSPDGQRIAFVARTGLRASVHVVERESGTSRRLTSAAMGDALAPSWSRDGRYVYFTAEHDGTCDVWRASSVDGSNIERVTEDGGFMARESLDGRSVLFTKRGEEGLFEQPLDRNEATKIAALPASVPWELGDDGGVFFHRASELVRLDPSSGAVHAVAAMPGALSREGFSLAPDGKSVLYAKMDHSESDLMLVDAFQ